MSLALDVSINIVTLLSEIAAVVTPPFPKLKGA
jgi:hypothetical protein